MIAPHCSLGRETAQSTGVVVYPLDKAAIERSVGLAQIREIHDRQIVATAFVLQDQGEMATLLTCDQNIVASGL